MHHARVAGRKICLDSYPPMGFSNPMHIPLRLLSAVEQVAQHLKNLLAAGQWKGEMPGVVALAGELGVNHKTVEGALKLLEREGLLLGQGRRRPRRIVLEENASTTRSLRIGLLLHDVADSQNELIVEIRHQLRQAGHAPFVTKRVVSELSMDVGKVAAWVEKQPADAWLVLAAPFDVLRWCSRQPFPVFALFGRFRRLSIAAAAPDKTAAYAATVRTMVGHGHRRIVLLSRPQHRTPVPSQAVRTFLKTLTSEGIEVSDYHNPYWQNTREGFQRCLESLFRGSPPTALVIQEQLLFGAAQQFLMARGIRVPGDVSLVCTDPDPSFAWRVPSVAHIDWDTGPVIRRVVRWANNVALGKDDRRKLLTHAEFVSGGTIGPVAQRFRTYRRS